VTKPLPITQIGVIRFAEAEKCHQSPIDWRDRTTRGLGGATAPIRRVASGCTKVSIVVRTHELSRVALSALAPTRLTVSIRIAVPDRNTTRQLRVIRSRAV
jgi:hypothetical protein